MIKKDLEAGDVTNIVNAAKKVNDLAGVLPEMLSVCHNLVGMEEDDSRFN